MLAELACLAGGLVPGRCLQGRSRAQWCIGKATTWSICCLLFIMGAQMGADEVLRRNIALLGTQALCISACCMIGSIVTAWVIYKLQALGLPPPHSPQASTAPGVGAWHALLQRLKLLSSSAVLILVFACGFTLGSIHCLPAFLLVSELATWLLRIMLFFVGMGMGFDLGALGVVRTMGVRVLFVPLITACGTAAGAIIAAGFVLNMPSCLAVGAGFGYYSLSSILITEHQGVALGSIALLSNIFRELLTLLTIPLQAKVFGPLAPIASAGATSMDTCLPVLVRATGEQYGIIALAHGLILTISVPFLVQLMLCLFPA